VQDNAEAWSILQGMVKELTATEAHLSNGDVLPYGMAVWSTGVGPTSFTTGLPFAKTARGRIAVDGGMRVLQHIDPEKAQGTEVHKPSDVSKQGVLCGGIQDWLVHNATCHSFGHMCLRKASLETVWHWYHGTSQNLHCNLMSLATSACSDCHLSKALASTFNGTAAQAILYLAQASTLSQGLKRVEIG